MAERVGVAVIGLSGAVATTAAAGIEMIRSGSNDLSGLPLADRDVAGLAAYRDLYFAGWDLSGDDLATAARGIGRGRTRRWRQCARVDARLAGSGQHRLLPQHRRREQDRRDRPPCRGRADPARYDAVPRRTPPRPDGDDQPRLDRAHARRGCGRARVGRRVRARARRRRPDDPAIGPTMLYAYAAIAADTPYGNFTPSVAADVAPLAELARQRGVPIAGKDGKTGQTLMKTVIAPALRDRALHVDGWFSTNILGNSDGRALDNPASLASKLGTKKTVLDRIMGYPVEDHIVMIHYYRPRGDDKEAWDNIDITGFLGQKMQLKLNFLCKDSVLAAPLVIEIARVLDLAAQRGDGGVQEQLGVFFKAPQTRYGGDPVHAFAEQQMILDTWLGAGA